MLEDTVRDSLLLTLAEYYENNPREFCRIPKTDLASALFRETVAELRNEGYVEEEVRGVIRFTDRAPQWLDFEHAFNQAYPGSHEVLTKAGRATNQYWPAESLPNVVTIGAGLEVFAVPALVMVSRPLAVHVARKHASQSHACAG